MMEQGEEDSEMSYIRLSADNETATRPKNGVESKQTTSEPSIASQVEPGVQHPTTLNAFQKFNARLESLAGLESRGIERVEPDERQPPSMSNYMQMSLIWLSANMTANNLTLGLLGPLSYDLGFVDSAICAVLGGFVGSVGASTMGIWGATSGNRTLVSYEPPEPVAFQDEHIWTDPVPNRLLLDTSWVTIHLRLLFC